MPARMENKNTRPYRIALLALGWFFGTNGAHPRCAVADCVRPRNVEVRTDDLPRYSVADLNRKLVSLSASLRAAMTSPLESSSVPQVAEVGTLAVEVAARRGKVAAAYFNGLPIEPIGRQQVDVKLGTNTLRAHFDQVDDYESDAGVVVVGVDAGSAPMVGFLLDLAANVVATEPGLDGLALLPGEVRIQPGAQGMQRVVRLSAGLMHDGIPLLREGLTAELHATADPRTFRAVVSVSSDQCGERKFSDGSSISPRDAHLIATKAFAPTRVHVDTPNLFLVGNPARPIYRAFVRGPFDATTSNDPVAALFTTHAAFVDAVSGTIVEIVDLQQGLTVPVVDGSVHDMDSAIQQKSFPHPAYAQGLLGPTPYYLSMGPYAHVRNNALAVNAPGWLVALTADGDDHATMDPDIQLIAPDTDPLPIWLMSPGFPSSNTMRDDELDIWTAYFHTSRSAYLTQQFTGFLHNFAAPAPNLPASALHVGVNLLPLSVALSVPWNPVLELSNALSVGAVAVPNMFQYPNQAVVLRAGTFFSRGVTYAESIVNGNLTHVRADATRDPGIIDHEFTHTVLFGQGFGGWNLSQDQRSIHEGIADYGARIMLNGEDELFDRSFFSPYPQTLNPGTQRYCGSRLMGDPRFVAVDADVPTTVNGTPVDPYVTGSAICQALASAEEELVRLDGQLPENIFDLVINSVPSWVPLGTISTMVEHLRLHESIGFNSQLWPNSHQFALITYLAAHGLVWNSQEPGREASVTFPDGAWSQQSYNSQQGVPYVIAGGLNDQFTLTFRSGSTPCYVAFGTIPSAQPSLVTHATAGQIPVSTLVQYCGSPLPPLIVDLWTCTGATDCRQPGAQHVVQMSQRPYAERLSIQ